MARRPVLLLLVALALLVPVVFALCSRADRPAGIDARMEGDVEGELDRMDPAAMPAAAEGLLATDRPWRAARMMRRYLERVPDAPAEHRLLAARAEAGWGGWAEAHALLQGVPGLEASHDGVGLYLLARARDARGETAGAVQAYRAYLALPPGTDPLDAARRDAARLRLGLALVRAGDAAAADRELAAASDAAGGAAAWFGVLRADALAQAGDTAAVRRATAEYDSGALGLRAWRARVEAARRAGDPAAARALANEARAWAGTDATRAEFLVAAARAALEMGDVPAGRTALVSAIGLGTSGPAARAAAELLTAGPLAPEEELAVARVYAAQGLHEEAIPGFERWLRSGAGTAAQQAEVRLEYGSSLYWAQRYDEVEAVLRPIARRPDAQQQLARAAARQGDAREAARIYLSLAERGGGVAALFSAAGTWHDANDTERAGELYRRVLAQHPRSDYAGLAIMRLAGIAFHEGDAAAAARLWDDYRARFPRGELALQSMYWSGRAREAAGDSAGAAALYRAVRERERDSYYALRASERLGVPFWPLPRGAAPPAGAAATARIAEWMRGVDMLREAGFADEASAEADRLVGAAGSDVATRYALAEALAERGYSQRAIRIGLALQGRGATNERLLRILYPFPYRTLITEEARDRGLDPAVTAALIRQESMFEARITSPVGARGLMQIMPATGAGLADAAGVEPWDAELLYHPEINVHLGTRYVARHTRNYDGSLPSVFSAYNAGEHRVEWWQEFAEHGDDELFTERIPFRETRDYVKILTRNRALYAGLYGLER